LKYIKIKNYLDFLIALLLASATLPILAIFALIIIIEDGPPFIIKQARIGKDRKTFILYKLRTMKKDIHLYAPKPVAEDKNITISGRFLRNSGLDELPQLFNVLKNEMSLIGPRPEMPFLAKEFKEAESKRFAVRPGITGLWQLSGKTNQPIRENIHYDLYYVEHSSFLLDLNILLKSIHFFIRNIFFEVLIIFKIALSLYV